MAREDGRLSFRVLSHGPYAFVWAVPVGGYVWRKDVAPQDLPLNDTPLARLEHAKRGPWLTSKVAPEIGAAEKLRQYGPLGVAALHGVFANLEPTEDGVLTFANQHGWLGRPEELLPWPEGRGFVLAGESLQFWQAEINAMHDLLCLWTIVNEARLYPHSPHDELKTLVHWNRAPRYVQVSWDAGKGAHARLGFRGTQASRIPRSPGESPELLDRWKVGDVVEPAAYYVHEQVNARLKGTVSPAVLPFRDDNLVLFPHNLLSALYVHFALSLSGKKLPALQCAADGCGRYFYPSKVGQKYCRPAHRVQQWRRENPKPKKTDHDAGPSRQRAVDPSTERKGQT